MSMARFEFDTPFCKALPPPPLSIGMPSTTNKGWLLDVKVVMPRIKMLDEAPTMPLAACTRTPATLAVSEFEMLVARAWVSSRD